MHTKILLYEDNCSYLLQSWRGLAATTAQTEISEKDSSWKKIVPGSYTKINDLVHTKLEVKFDYPKAWMYGKAWITLKPHFYSTDSLTLDAKGMDIKEVSHCKG